MILMKALDTIKLGLRQLAVVACLASYSIQLMAEPDVDSGAALFTNNCESCHGPNGDGNGNAAEGFVLKPRDFALAAFKFDTDADWERGTDKDLANVIRQGTEIYGGAAVMPAWAHLSKEEVSDLIVYIRSLER